MQKTLAVIDIKLLIENARYVRSLIGDRIFYAVVKADGYGHGGAEVASAIEEVVDGFCVAITDEGASLRLAGISKPVLVLTPPLGADDVRRAKFYNLTLTVNSVKTAKMIGDSPCHIKVNTGMNRFGCDLNELSDILNLISAEQIAGVYSHMFNPADSNDSLRQLALFDRAERMVKAVNPEVLSHFAASGGILADKKYLKDGVRCGILLYGYPPEGLSAKVKPVLKIYARMAQKTRFIGGGAGYVRASKNYDALSVYRLGYADGFARSVPIGESPLCMDTFLSEDVKGTKFTDFRLNTDEELRLVLSDAAEYAKKCGTIPYEVICSVTRRAEKIYVYGDE